MKKFFIFMFLFLLFIYTCNQPETSNTGGNSSNDSNNNYDGEYFVNTYQNGIYPSLSYAGCTDTYIVKNSPDYNYGISSVICVGLGSSNNVYRGLIKFDIKYTVIPSTVKVVAAYLTLHPQVFYLSNKPVIGVYRITNDWIEGSGNGSNDPGETGATWNRQCSDVGEDDLWTTAGGDYDVLMSDTKSVSFGDWFFTFTLDPLIVEQWLNGTGANFGMIIKVVNESGEPAGYYGFSSRNDVDLEERPKLTIYYKLP